MLRTTDPFVTRITKALVGLTDSLLGCIVQEAVFTGEVQAGWLKAKVHGGEYH